MRLHFTLRGHDEEGVQRHKDAIPGVKRLDERGKKLPRKGLLVPQEQAWLEASKSGHIIQWVKCDRGFYIHSNPAAARISYHCRLASNLRLGSAKRLFGASASRRLRLSSSLAVTPG